MSRATLKAIQAAAGNAGESAVYVDDVFSTYLYDGNGSSQTITNGIDLDGEGGMILVQKGTINLSTSCLILNVVELNGLTPQVQMLESTASPAWMHLTQMALVTQGINGLNNQAQEMASWTFRKQPGFFDIVTYTGTGSYQGSISHNLGSTPGMILIKRTDSTGNWVVWHRGTDPNNLQFNSTTISRLAVVCNTGCYKHYVWWN